MADRMKHLAELLGNPDAKVRLYALDEVIRNAHRMTEPDLAKLLSQASSDEDKGIALRAAEGLAILEQRGFKQLRRARDRRAGLAPLAETPREDEGAREAAFKILDEVLQELGGLANDMVVARANAALQAMGAFRYPGSLGPMLKALARRDTAQAASKAVSRYPEDAALPVFKKALENRTFPELPSVVLGALGELDEEGSFLILRNHAESDEPRVREAVAHALGARPEKDAEALLVRMLQDPEPSVVTAAVGSLGLVGEGKGAEALHELFVNAGDVRLQAGVLSALALIHRNESVEVIAKGLRNPDGRVRANAVEALAGYNLRPAEALRYFEPLLKDENNRAVGNAILAIYPYDRDRSVAALHRLLKAKEPLKRSTAAYIIGEIQDPTLMQGLITMINTEQDRNVLGSALTSIERIRNPEMKVGISKLCQHPNDLIRGRAIQIFAGMSGLSELKVLESFFQKETSPTVRATIVAAFGHVCDMNHLAFLKNKLRDRDDRIVANAIEALDRIGALENVELIEPFLGHHSHRVRANAMIALWHQGNLRVADRLAEMLETTDDDQLSSALHAAKAFAHAIGSFGLRRYPMLRSSLQSAFDRMSSMGVTSWDLFKSSTFYQDVILASSMPDEADVTEEELDAAEEAAAAAEEAAVAEAEAVSVEPGAGEVQEAPPAAAAEAAGPVVSPGEVALVKGLGALLAGQAGRAAESLEAAPKEGPERGLLLHLVRRASREAGHMPPELPLEDAPGAPPFLPVRTARIEKARNEHDLGGSLEGYFSLYRAQLEMLEHLVRAGELTLQAGQEASAAKIAKDLAQYVKGDASLHRKIGNLFFGHKDYALAYEHLLRAWAHTPDEPELLLRLASVTARLGKLELARAMLKLLLEVMEADPETRKKAASLEQILAKRMG